jgi:hypothetical protein
MHRVTKTIQVRPGSELDRLLTEIDSVDLQFERDGVRYRINRVEEELSNDIWSDYDPDLALAGIRSAAGSWSDIDAEALKDELYRARERGSRPSTRP